MRSAAVIQAAGKGSRFHSGQYKLLTPVDGVPMILRTLGGFALFFGLNTLLKLPFSKEFLESAAPTSFAVRSLRYLAVTFALIGPYPMLFKLFDKKGSAEGSVKEEN